MADCWRCNGNGNIGDCPECEGAKTEECGDCKGKKKLPSGENCTRCAGRGVLDCMHCPDPNTREPTGKKICPLCHGSKVQTFET